MALFQGASNPYFPSSDGSLYHLLFGSRFMDYFSLWAFWSLLLELLKMGGFPSPAPSQDNLGEAGEALKAGVN